MITVKELEKALATLKRRNVEACTYAGLLRFLFYENEVKTDEMIDTIKELNDFNYQLSQKLCDCARSSYEYSLYLKTYLSGKMYVDQGTPDNHMKVQYKNADKIYKKAEYTLYPNQGEKN